MAVGDWSTTPANNTSLEGISIAEGCPAANVNNVIRAVAAAVRVMYDALPVTANYVLKDGSVSFTGQPLYSGRGAFLHHAASPNSSARIFVQPAGGPAPTMADGDFLLEY